jgi:hypothetical protein
MPFDIEIDSCTIETDDDDEIGSMAVGCSSSWVRRA